MSENLKAQSLDPVDVIVVGGGAAGLSAALTLARARRSVLVIDAGESRNAPAAGVHGFVGHDGVPPAELLTRGRSEVTSYGATVLPGRAVAARRERGGFTLTLADGREASSRRLLLAGGLVDHLPDIPGVAQRWGRDAIHCPYCHSWEVRDRAIGVLGTSPMSVHQALLVRQSSADVTLFAGSLDLDPEQWERLAAREIAVVDGQVTGLEITDDAITGVRTEDGRVTPREVVMVATTMGALRPARQPRTRARRASDGPLHRRRCDRTHRRRRRLGGRQRRQPDRAGGDGRGGRELGGRADQRRPGHRGPSGHWNVGSPPEPTVPFGLCPLHDLPSSPAPTIPTCTKRTLR